MNNSFFNNPIVHSIVNIILFALPFVISHGGSWQQMTVGGILMAIYKALQNKYQGLTVGGRPL